MIINTTVSCSLSWQISSVVSWIPPNWHRVVIHRGHQQVCSQSGITLAQTGWSELPHMFQTLAKNILLKSHPLTVANSPDCIRALIRPKHSVPTPIEPAEVLTKPELWRQFWARAWIKTQISTMKNYLPNIKTFITSWSQLKSFQCSNRHLWHDLWPVPSPNECLAQWQHHTLFMTLHWW